MRRYIERELLRSLQHRGSIKSEQPSYFESSLTLFVLYRNLLFTVICIIKMITNNNKHLVSTAYLFSLIILWPKVPTWSMNKVNRLPRNNWNTTLDHIYLQDVSFIESNYFDNKQY